MWASLCMNKLLQLYGAHAEFVLDFDNLSGDSAASICSIMCSLWTTSSLRGSEEPPTPLTSCWKDFWLADLTSSVIATCSANLSLSSLFSRIEALSSLSRLSIFELASFRADCSSRCTFRSSPCTSLSSASLSLSSLSSAWLADVADSRVFISLFSASRRATCAFRLLSWLDRASAWLLNSCSSILSLECSPSFARSSALNCFNIIVCCCMTSQISSFSTSNACNRSCATDSSFSKLSMVNRRSLIFRS
mmetsp:Transcript_6852/g.15788  ORF Transcript_6852/g.15788 Transcript_6852/m.15788 type:complete len:249 (-) Transcript_6852:18-764(-)